MAGVSPIWYWATVLSAWWVEAGASRNRATHMPQRLFPRKHKLCSAKLHVVVFRDDVTSSQVVPMTPTGVYNVAWQEQRPAGEIQIWVSVTPELHAVARP